jgi:hypothetical protein
VTRLPPLKGISPWDSHSRKESRSRDHQNGIWVDGECRIHWGIMSFFNNHLVDSFSSKVLPSSQENGVGTSIGRWVGWRHPIGVWSQLGTHMSIVVLFPLLKHLRLIGSFVVFGIVCSLYMFWLPEVGVWRLLVCLITWRYRVA